MGREDKSQQSPRAAVDAEVEVTDTGNATAESGATAVSGHRGATQNTEAAPGIRLTVSKTGHANAIGPGAIAVSGSMTVVQQRVPQEPAPWPHQVGVIPSRAQSFQHRAEADRLRATVEGGGTAVLSQVLTGMGGVGKTQLAADYARAAWEDGGMDVLVWVTASAQSPVVTGYAQAGVELCRADPDDPAQAARSFLAWLTPKAGQRPCRWLIVLDDVADPNDLRGLWPPTSPHGRALVTTRRRDAALNGEGRRLIEVGLFTESEAFTYLTASLAAHGRHEPADQLTALASDLGHLPLALAQAAAYLVDSGDDVAAYRDLLAARTTTLADAAPDRLPDDQALPLAAAWSLSIDRADTLRPVGLARPMLHLAAMLDPNGIPSNVLTSPPALTHFTAHLASSDKDTAGELDQVSPRDAVRALRALHRLSLIDHTPDNLNQAVRIHQLIQRATRDTCAPDQRDLCARAAADALEAVWPRAERDTALAQALRANTDALYRHVGDALWHSGAYPVLFRSGMSLGETGQVLAATTYFHQLTDAARRCLGPDHSATLTARLELASWQGQSGDAAGAAAALTELLADRQRVHGPDHPHTLATRSHLARWRGEAGDPPGAGLATAELLNAMLRVLGPDHVDTLAARGNLARWQGRAGDAAGAAAAFAELLADRHRVLGPNHPHTLATRQDLARSRGEAGDVAGAAAAFAELLADQERVLGPNHPQILATRHNLAYWREEAGGEHPNVG